MSDCAYSRYELVPKQPGARRREGALVRYFGRPSGYGDCHPWPELGDLSLDEQLLAYYSREGTPLLVEAFGCAIKDSWARAAGTSAFEGLTIPPSHASMPDALSDAGAALHELDELARIGFDRVKVKVSRRWGDALRSVGGFGLECAKRGFRVRLDFNENFEAAEVLTMLDEFNSGGDGLDWLDWLEDPCPFEPEAWRRIREQYGVRLAIDFAADPLTAELEGAVDVIVLKPALRAQSKVRERADQLGLPICVTSYLGHPVGQVFAALVAADAAKRGSKLETCGLLTHEVYEPTEFSERLKTNGPVLIAPEGTGIGFDDLLENLPWVELK